jgi:hypothetical protein
MAMNQANLVGVAVTEVTGTYSVQVADYSVLCDATGGAFSVTLPPAASSDQRVLQVKKIDASANAVTIDGYSSELVEDAATQALVLQGENLMLACDGVQWWVL